MVRQIDVEVLGIECRVDVDVGQLQADVGAEAAGTGDADLDCGGTAAAVAGVIQRDRPARRRGEAIRTAEPLQIGLVLAGSVRQIDSPSPPCSVAPRSGRRRGSPAGNDRTQRVGPERGAGQRLDNLDPGGASRSTRSSRVSTRVPRSPSATSTKTGLPTAESLRAALSPAPRSRHRCGRAASSRLPFPRAPSTP